MLANSSNLAEIVRAERVFYANVKRTFFRESPATLHMVNSVILWEIIRIQVMCRDKKTKASTTAPVPNAVKEFFSSDRHYEHLVLSSKSKLQKTIGPTTCPNIRPPYSPQILLLLNPRFCLARIVSHHSRIPRPIERPLRSHHEACEGTSSFPGPTSFARSGVMTIAPET
ncbi:uncharacterized protein FTOL_11523 [Fusarium torulosum]|uniref:Uncharacterized protein n=1 Tax=Fusarium torulosum TaxID=33205 RepID=A0AAE8MIG6_9HYPO|nr:uncharacterized protein FTOL_11523 [Fusarium torulosum]